ncbi:unnamed protein product [Dimorphilus gyrociliatus]|nr:unnamed protein product [Dimorphilus gyrociliatus]
MMHTKHYSNILHEVKSSSGKKEGTLHCEVCGQDVECSKFGAHAQQCVKRDNSKSPQQETEIERKPSPLPLVEPADEDAPSALKAMQSFIERSFSTTPKNSLPSSRSSSTSPKRKYIEDEEVRQKDNEHPLNSLQRLIKNTETTSSSTPNIILVNPIVTVVSPSEKTPPIEKENSEFTCPVCKRAYVSKGSYRYHVSRCHVRPGKRKMDGKGEIGEKLTNYYKLAAELSSK